MIPNKQGFPLNGVIMLFVFVFSYHATYYAKTSHNLLLEFEITLLRFGEHKSIEIKAETCLKSLEKAQFDL